MAISPDEYRIVGQTAVADLEELVALSRDRELDLIAAVGTAPLVDPLTSIACPKRSVRSAIAAGVELVVIRGDGLLGGPACGILLGKRETINRIMQHPMFAAWQLDAMRSAALAATLDYYRDSARGVENLPAWQLLTTPIDNLRNRAERIAPQLAQAPEVASATVLETRSPISGAMSAGSDLASVGVALTPSNGSITDLDNRLRTLPLPIYGRIENDRLVLDLRTVFPRQDCTLVEAIVGARTPEQLSQNENTVEDGQS